MIRWTIEIEIGQADERLPGLVDCIQNLRDYLVVSEVGNRIIEERDHVPPG